MTTKCTGRCKLTQFMSYYLISNKDWSVVATSMNRDIMTNYTRHDYGRTRPCCNSTVLTLFIYRSYLLQKMISYKRTFSRRTSHINLIVIKLKATNLRRRRMSVSLYFFEDRVFTLNLIFPEDVTGAGRPIGQRPSPPPCG